MKGLSPSFFRPYVAALCGGLLIAVMLAMMLATMSLTAFQLQWIVFLSGILIAAIFATGSHSALHRALEGVASHLEALGAKVAIESQLRADAEKALARVNSCKELIDVAMPAMLAYMDAGSIVRYHNHCYAQWVGLPDSAIDGRSVEELMGRAVHARIEKHLEGALEGREQRYERTQTMASGEVMRLFVQYLPHFGANGKVVGVFAILTDITRAEDLAPAAPDPLVAGAMPEAGAAARLIAALQNNEFCLYSQLIAPLGAAGDGASFCEVLLRLKREEENLLPPGSFLPIAEEHGLLPDIDRWVVRNVLDAASAQWGVNDAVYFVNLSAPTVLEGGFAEFVRAELAERKLGGKVLCFELPEENVLAHRQAYAELIAALNGTGCRFAVSGFGSNPASLRVLGPLGVNYLKLDGAMALSVVRDPAELAKVEAINVAAHLAGMHVVAQCVEDEAARAALQRIATDFAQGFGISVPRPMDQQQRRLPYAA